jgi:putative ABC transport system ATP-binding protein
MEPLVRTRGLSKIYQVESAPVPGLAEVDLAIGSGELVVLMGSSGSGKSTLLYLLSGLERPTAGEIHFAGRRVDAMDETELSLLRRSEIGFVFQAINLISHLTLLENVVLPGYLLEPNRSRVDRRAHELLDAMGIADLAGRLPAQVSGGEQQRAAIARAMINRPKAILADEPTGALNSAAGTAVLDRFKALNAQGQTIIMATHEVRSACIGDRVLFLKDGRLQSEYRLAETGPGPAEREAALLGWLVQQGW